MSLYDNDDDGARPSPTDFEKGHIALILAETILHILVEKKLLTTEDAVSALQTTAEVSMALASRNAEPPESKQAAVDALFQMMDSFAADLEPETRGQARLNWEESTRPA